MEPRNSAQDLVRCHHCEKPSPLLYCDICHVHLCKVCVEKHLSDESTEHKVVPIKKQGFLPECINHSQKLCELHCEQCDIPLCVECVSSRKHLGHKAFEILKHLENKKKDVKRDLQELENIIYPQYKEIASCIPVEKANLRKEIDSLYQ